jgi:hypothetical protein
MRHGSGPGGLCHFCGITAIRNGPGGYKHMSLELATKIADDMKVFCPKARIEFAMRGEPLMNPKHLDIFMAFRDRLPDASMMVTTNGDTLRTPPGRPFTRMQQQMDLMFKAGLNFVLLDTYYPAERRQQLIDEARSLQNIQVLDYFVDLMPNSISPYSNHHKWHRTVVLMDDLSVRDGTHGSRMVKTHAGANETKSISGPLKRNCARPFREMTIAWDGAVTLCCDDWRKQMIIANVNQFSLRDIWVHPLFEAARARLMQKDRAWGICAECDAPAAPRSGLLPVYDPPTEEQIKMTDANYTNFVPLWRKK